MGRATLTQVWPDITHWLVQPTTKVRVALPMNNPRSYPPPTGALAKRFLPVAHESSHGPACDEPGFANAAAHAERIIDRKINVSVALVGIRLVPNIDLLFIRQSDADMDLEKTAGPVVLPWTFQHHATACNPALSFLERRNVPRNGYAQPLLRFHALKLDMHWGFHLGSYRRAKESVLASN
jgi:hypothetical protein